MLSIVEKYQIKLWHGFNSSLLLYHTMTESTYMCNEQVGVHAYIYIYTSDKKKKKDIF